MNPYNADETRELEDMRTFREWLLGQQRRKDHVGDLARSVKADTCLPPDAQSVEELVEHMVAHGVDTDGEMAETMERAKRGYNSRGTHYLTCDVWEGGPCNCLLPGLMRSLRAGTLFSHE